MGLLKGLQRIASFRKAGKDVDASKPPAQDDFPCKAVPSPVKLAEAYGPRADSSSSSAYGGCGELQATQTTAATTAYSAFRAGSDGGSSPFDRQFDDDEESITELSLPPGKNSALAAANALSPQQLRCGSRKSTATSVSESEQAVAVLLAGVENVAAGMPEAVAEAAWGCSDADRPRGALSRRGSDLREPGGTQSQEAPLNFNLSLEEIYVGIGEAYGQMIATSLRSTKWDKRSQALKAMSTVLKGLDLRGMAPPGSTGVLGKGLKLRDRVRCWQLCCQLLGHTMQDKVMPVRLAAHELFLEAFSNTEGVVSKAEVHSAAGVLLDKLIDRLGDSNLRLHESARKCVLFTAEHPGLLGLTAVLQRLRTRLAAKSRDRAKTYFGILDTVNFFLQHFPGCNEEGEDEDEASGPGSWRMEDVAPFVIAGMEDSNGQRIRSSAAALAVAMYQTVGMEAMQPLLKDLRPAKQALLKQKFEDVEGGMCMDDDCTDGAVTRRGDLDGLVVCGNAVRPPPGYRLEPIPGAVHNQGYDEEESLMDGILEEVGMVFSGTGIINEEERRRQLYGTGRSQGQNFNGSLVESLGLDLVEEEQRYLEEELMNLGMDLEELDEQQALMSSLEQFAQQPQRVVGSAASRSIEAC